MELKPSANVCAVSPPATDPLNDAGSHCKFVTYNFVYNLDCNFLASLFFALLLNLPVSANHHFDQPLAGLANVLLHPLLGRVSKL